MDRSWLRAIHKYNQLHNHTCTLHLFVCFFRWCPNDGIMLSYRTINCVLWTRLALLPLIVGTNKQPLHACTNICRQMRAWHFWHHIHTVAGIYRTWLARTIVEHEQILVLLGPDPSFFQGWLPRYKNVVVCKFILRLHSMICVYISFWRYVPVQIHSCTFSLN